MNLAPLLLGVCLALPTQPTAALQVELSFSKSVNADAFTGRVFVIASKTPINEKNPPPAPGWFKPYPFFAQEVTKWSPDTPMKFQPQFAFPDTWGTLPKEKYYLQAILDRDVDQTGPKRRHAGSRIVQTRRHWMVRAVPWI